MARKKKSTGDPSPAPGREVEPWKPAGLAAFPDPGPPGVRDVDIYGALMADSLTPNTRQARHWDMVALAHYLGQPGAREAARLFVSGTAGQAGAIGLGFRRHMMDLGQSAATVNRRLATLRRLVKLARRLGLVAWELDVDGLPQERYRETAGPGDDGWRKLLAFATGRAASGSHIGARDLVCLRLMHDSGLRISEVIGLDLVDVDVAGRKVAVVGKGRREKQSITINAPTAAALSAWLGIRGPLPGPVFPRMTRANCRGEWNNNWQTIAGGGKPGRLNPRGLYASVVRLGDAAGVECRPHGLRHSGATRLLDLTNGDVRAVQKWTRHTDVRTVLIYDDNRRDLAGGLTDRLGDDSPEATS
jgi:integrase/recombinase XerC